MKAWKLVITVVLCVTVLLPSGRSVESPVTRNPAGYGTIPQSSFRSGLVNTPNPVDPTGNLLMTGNVRRGMHFRGSVPYRSTTSFNASLGSSALNSFLRDTAGSEDFIDRSNKYRVQPFYSPTQTVTTMVPGRSEVFSPMGMRIDDRVRQGASFVGDGLLGLDSLPRGQISMDQDSDAGESDFQELQKRYDLLAKPSSTSEDTFPSGVSRSSRQAELLVPGQLGIRQARDIPTDRSRERDRDAKRGMQDLAIDSRQDSESGFVDLQQRQKLPARDDLTQYPGEEVSFGSDETSSISRKMDNRTQDTKPESEVHSLASDDRREVLEQIRRQLDALAKSVEAGLQKDVGSVPDNRYSMLDERDSKISHEEHTTTEASELLESHFGPTGKNQTQLEFHRAMNEVGTLSTVSSLDEFRQRAETNVSTNIEQTKENYEDLESFSQSRFNQHISTAENHLKAGRYYRAVDSFTLAAIYQPNNPVVLAGQSHALFAAGEYMSSALFLARALAVRPEDTQTKVGFTAMLGGADKLTERIADVEQWLARSGSAQLQFLLSYVYFHTGKLNQAKQAITAAYEKMPDSPAVVALRTAINQTAK